MKPMTEDEMAEMREYLRPLGLDYRQDRDRARLLATVAARDEETARLNDEHGRRIAAYNSVLVNLHAIIRDRECDPLASIGLATSAVLECVTERDRLRTCIDDMVSYLGHTDQDADHAWMVKKMREARRG